MLTGGKKYQKPIKTKFRKSEDTESVKPKQKHHDKSTWRLLKTERKESGI